MCDIPAAGSNLVWRIRRLNLAEQGYYRFPTIHRDTVVFASEDDLWTVPAGGGIPRRLTSGLGAASHPALSPDGNWLAFSGKEEGPIEVYVMPADGGQPKRLTYLGSTSFVIGWTNDGKIIFASDWKQPFMRHTRAFTVSRDGGEPSELPVGPASFVSFGPKMGCVIGRPSVEAAYWKRYRGGTTGDIWIDDKGDGNFRRLVKVEGNPSRPNWIGERIYFLSDHEGVANIYSCKIDGKDLRRHTHHDDFYARSAMSDGQRIAYHAGGDLFVFDTKSDESRKVEIGFHSPRTQRNRKFIDPAKFLEFYDLAPKGHMLALTVRGKFLSMGNWEGPVTQHGEPAAGRYRLATWMNDGKRLVVVSDDEGCESIQVHSIDDPDAKQRIVKLDSRVVDLAVDPKSDQIAITNHRNELAVIEPGSAKPRVLDRSEYTPMYGFDYSPDGKWIAYACGVTLHTAIIKLARLEDGKIFNVTRPVLRDTAPVFDPEGKYLYFLSYREFDPVYDAMHFDLGFPKGMKPYLVTLRADLPSPFALVPKAPEEPAKKDEKRDEPPKEEPLRIDVEGIEDRVVAFPVPEAIYQQIGAIKGKVLWTTVPVEGSLKRTWVPGTEPPAKATLDAFDFETLKAETLLKNLSNFKLSRDGKMLAYRAGSKLRVVKAGEKIEESPANNGFTKKSGWIDLKRLRIDISPPAEWQQMYGEAWRLQREHFWVEDLARVDWQSVYDRYRPLLDRVSTRTEFSDLLGEMQGELGSSHAYVVGGDFREEPKYDIGFLGADVQLDPKSKLWKIQHIVRGDPWDEEKGSPLLRPGINAKVGEAILAVNGRRTSADVSPMQLLVHQAGVEVALTLGDAKGQNPRTVLVKTVRAETPLRYRDWVEANRAFVHEKTGGRCGYVHVPNMGPVGYAEFHRSYLGEVDRDGLVVDVRFNGGGHVSALLIEKLARKRVGFVQTRWFGVQPHPEDAPAGPMVALTNEFAGSDGDIFSHHFKQMKLGPLIGKRTWGGVIGIWPRHTLIDGGVTTQPEFSFWFADVGWQVENYGVDPDIEVEYPPQDYVAGRDPQLLRAVDEVMKQLETGSWLKPQFGPVPDRSLPKLMRAK
jgi:tricorn protease